jgi:hypothetical protein
MTASPAQRDAELRLRATAGPLQTHVWWPHSPPRDSTTGLLMFFVDETVSVPWLRELSSRAALVVVAVPCAVLGAGDRLANAMTAVEWAAEHARELEADPARLVVGGSGAGAALAAAAALNAQAEGWPPIARLLLIEPDVAGSEPPALPTTLVSADEIRHAAPDRLVADLARSLRG